MPDMRLLLDGLEFPEGPCFAPDGNLWWVEIEGGCIGCLDAEGPKIFEVGGRPNGAVFGPDGILWIADQGLNAIRRFDPETGIISTVTDRVNGVPLGKPNDLCFDPAGRLVFTCSNDARTEAVGYVCRLSEDGQVGMIVDNLMFPNGIAFGPDQELYVAETYRQRVIRIPYGDTLGAWEHHSATPAPTGPDGMAFATDGSLFVAVFGQGCVAHYGSDGALLTRLCTPGVRPTNVAIDPFGKLGLVVTEVETGAIYACPTQAQPFLENGTTSSCSI